MPTKEEVGKYLRDYIKTNNVCIMDIARQIGASQSSVYNWLAGLPMLNVYYNRLIEILAPYYGFDVSNECNNITST